LTANPKFKAYRRSLEMPTGAGGGADDLLAYIMVLHGRLDGAAQRHPCRNRSGTRGYRPDAAG
jgi:hypothetical protein